MSVPQWADTKLSAKLLELIEQGESNSMEFKRQIPDNTTKLAQEIAALATSGGGQILLGVSDNGQLEGLPLNDGGERDEYHSRIQGIVDSVRPSVKASLKFAVANGKTVCAITIGKQDEPVFYVDHRPYIRDERRSRPARPEEVKESVWSHPSSQHKRELEQHALEAKKRFDEQLWQIRSGRGLRRDR